MSRPDEVSANPEATAHAARLLYRTARELAADGAAADDVFPHRLHALPPELAEALAPVLRLPDRTTGWRVVPGLLSRFGDCGPTPAHWRTAPNPRTRALDIALVLVTVALGGIFGWRGQQDGRLVHNIVPSAGYENMQVGASSTTELAWHTEDAFHPRRAELLLLACLRNPDRVGSRVAALRRTGLTPHQLDVLGRRVLAILPDDSYPGEWHADDPAAAGIPTVWWADDGPCLRYDPSYSRRLVHDPEFEAAYTALGRALNACATSVDVAAGDLLLIDNDVAVHGRAPFRPRYDGSDRWLKRTLVRLPRPRPVAERHEPGYGQLLVEPLPVREEV